MSHRKRFPQIDPVTNLQQRVVTTAMKKRLRLIELCMLVGLIVIVDADAAPRNDVVVLFQNCSSLEPVKSGCCFLDNYTTLLCRQSPCPPSFYNLNEDSVVSKLAEGSYPVTKDIDHFLETNGNGASTGTHFDLCKPCHHSCANCSGPGVVNCLACAEGYTKGPAVLNGTCVRRLGVAGGGIVGDEGDEGDPGGDGGGENLLLQGLGGVFAFLAVAAIVLAVHKRKFQYGQLPKLALSFCGVRAKARSETLSPASSLLAEFDLVDEIEVPTACKAKSDQPIFCSKWQLSKTFGVKGGILQGEQSDVVLTLPEGALNSQRDVTAAICTDLEAVRKKLRLAEDEHIVTPVAEYHAQQNQNQFLKPVEIILPHFLPPSWRTIKVNVYQVHRDADSGEVTSTRLKAGSKGKARSGTFYTDATEDGVVGKVHIFTDHFTGFLCTVCSQTVLPQPLILDVMARHKADSDVQAVSGPGILEASGGASGKLEILSLVDIRLYIWIGNKYLVKDFRMQPLEGLSNLRGMKSVDLKTLESYRGSDRDVSLRAQLTVDCDTMWQHTLLQGEIKFPSAVNIGILNLVECHCNMPFQLVEWQLRSQRPCDVIKGSVTAFYVTKDGQSLSGPRMQIVELCVEKERRESSCSSGSDRGSLGQDVHAENQETTPRTRDRRTHTRTGSNVSGTSVSSLEIKSVKNLFITMDPGENTPRSSGGSGYSSFHGSTVSEGSLGAFASPASPADYYAEESCLPSSTSKRSPENETWEERHDETRVKFPAYGVPESGGQGRSAGPAL